MFLFQRVRKKWAEKYLQTSQQKNSVLLNPMKSTKTTWFMHSDMHLNPATRMLSPTTLKNYKLYVWWCFYIARNVFDIWAAVYIYSPTCMIIPCQHVMPTHARPFHLYQQKCWVWICKSNLHAVLSDQGYFICIPTRAADSHWLMFVSPYLGLISAVHSSMAKCGHKDTHLYMNSQMNYTHTHILSHTQTKHTYNTWHMLTLRHYIGNFALHVSVVSFTLLYLR